MHNPIGTMIIVDEGSDTPYSITRSMNGFLTEINPNRFWVMSSNPRRLSGHFYDIFTKPLNDWCRFQVDSRKVEGIDPSFHEGLIESHGMDSDIVRVDVLGQFPNQEMNCFIPHNFIQEAMEREAYPDMYAPLIMGCDIAGEGTDKTVVVLRRGNTIEGIFHWSGELVHNTNLKIKQYIDAYEPDAIVVDGVGIGGGTADYLQYVVGCNRVTRFIGHERSTQPNVYRNKRTEIYDYVKQAIISSLRLPKDHPELINELKSIVSFQELNTGRLAIESKRKGKSQYGVSSPDFVDALAYTYAISPERKEPIHPSQMYQVDDSSLLSNFRAREENWI